MKKRSELLRLPRVTEVAHDLVRRFVGKGDRVVDATVGNGFDTAFLADLVGPDGQVYGFDIQQSALDSASTRLGSHSCVDLFCAGHETMNDHVAGKIRAAMFNLGYLPSGDKGIVTLPHTTCLGLDKAFRLLTVPGMLSIVVYPGHEGGREEQSVVEDWVANLDPETSSVARWNVSVSTGNPPYLIAVVKTAIE